MPLSGPRVLESPPCSAVQPCWKPWTRGELIYLGEHAVWTGPDGKAVMAPPKQLKKIQGYYGLVFQNFNLFPHYSVIRNVTDALITVQKKSKEEALTIGRDLLEKMSLSDKENAYPYQLSGDSSSGSP